MIHWEFVPNGVQLMQIFILNNWNKFMNFERKYPEFVNRNRVLLQQDNARPHTARTTMIKIQKLGGIELLPHPAYSPDLVSSDYHMFRSMAHFMHGRNLKKLKLWK